jgi:hypothetical protein
MPAEKELRMLRKFITRERRHKSMGIFVTVHGILANNINSLIPHFDRIIFTCSTQNKVLFDGYIGKFAPVKETAELWWKRFIRYGNVSTYLQYSSKLNTFQITDIHNEDIENDKTQLRNRLEHYLTSFPNTEEKLILYDYIFEFLPIGLVSKDFTISATGANRTISKCNLIDLLHYVTAVDAGKPTREVANVFRIMRSKFSIPNVFLKNVHFK